MLENNIMKIRYDRFGNVFNKPIIQEETFEEIDFRNSLKSINIVKDNYTNFFTSNNTDRYIRFKELYKKHKANENIFNNLLSGDEIQHSNKDKLNRLCNILSITNNHEHITIQDLVHSIIKFKFKKDVTMQIYIKKENNKLYVYLIDLYHLAIPATNTKTGRSDYTKIYEKRKNANYCLSNILDEDNNDRK